MAEINIKNITKSFVKHKALKSINLDIKDREFVVLLGASGCGKTTLLRIIAGLETASGGEVFIGKRQVDRLHPKDRGIAMVFQNYAVFPHMTVADNIGFGLKMNKIEKEKIERKVKQTAELLHIENLLTRYSGELSGGQRQRVAVARALAMEPEVILMDEPLSNLDALLRLEMRAELKGVLADSNTTTIYVTHDQVEAMSLADRIAVMHNGSIVQAASPIDVYRDPATMFVAGFIGNPPMNFLPATKISNKKWKVANNEFDGPSFEGESLQLAIRPEDMQPTEEKGIEAKIKVLEPLGPNLLVTCDVSGLLFRAILDSNLVSSLKTNQVIKLKLRSDRIRWFDEQTSKNIKN